MYRLLFCKVLQGNGSPPECRVAIAPDHALFSRPSAFVATGFVVQLVCGRAQLRYRSGFAMLTKKGVVGSLTVFVAVRTAPAGLPHRQKPTPTFRGG